MKITEKVYYWPREDCIIITYVMDKDTTIVVYEGDSYWSFVLDCMRDEFVYLGDI